MTGSEFEMLEEEVSVVKMAWSSFKIVPGRKGTGLGPDSGLKKTYINVNLAGDCDLAVQRRHELARNSRNNMSQKS